MEEPEFITCKTEWIPDTEESNSHEPDNMQCDPDQMSPEADIEEDVSRLIKQEPLTEEIWLQNHPDELVAVKIEEDIAATIAPNVKEEISCSESCEGSGMDGNTGVEDEIDDLSGSLKNDVWSSSEDPPLYSQQRKGGGLHAATVENSNQGRKSPPIHNDVAPYVCNICSKYFRIKSHLKQHMVKHSEDRPHMCSICNVGFKRKGTFVRHMAIHKGIKLFKCSICGKDFRTKKDITDHMVSHSDEKLFSCSECGKEFKNRSTIISHLKVHSSVKGNHCNSSFKHLPTSNE